MVNYRIILVSLVALAVAVAPVGVALLAAPAAAEAAATHDCHGKDRQDINKASCPDCGSKITPSARAMAANKLTGTIAVPPALIVTVTAVDRAADPQEPPGWQLRPRPPPPRS